jgi:septal ring factor EnvC (AmiA/AmiB activator)
LSSEFQRKERALNKTLEALKRQCEQLRTQLLEESRGQAAVTEDLKTVADRAVKIDRKRKDLEATLATSRSQYEARIRDLQSQLSQYQVRDEPITSSMMSILKWECNPCVQSEVVAMEREHALGEEKLKSACQISEERVKTTQERMQAMEQEVAATRCVIHRNHNHNHCDRD